MGGMTRPSSKPRVVIPVGQPLAPEDVVVWNWPLRDEGLKSWAMLATAVALVAAVWSIWRDAPFTILAATALALSLWRLWLPVKWELGLTGVTQTALGLRRRIPWMAIARFEYAPAGVWLFSDREESSLRGVFIGYGGQRERVTACIDYYLGTWTSSTDSTQSLEQ